MLNKSEHLEFESVKSEAGSDNEEDHDFDDITPDEDVYDLFQFISTDFLGSLKNKTLEVKKIRILDIYRYFYRFSREKMRYFVDDPLLMLFTLQYIKDTEMKRIHERDTLMKNTDAYYRATENMLNLSIFKNEIKNIMP